MRRLSARRVGYLREARSLLAKGWTKGRIAADDRGQRVNADSIHACKFCMTGALSRVMPPMGKDGWLEDKRAVHAVVVREIRRFSDHTSIQCFNDDPATTRNAMLNVMDSAIHKES